ncbi:MAG: DUF5615 family PIN-like protein [Polyangiaceae bacterium]
MTRFLVDEDFNNDLVRGLLRRHPLTDLVRVQDLGLRGASDEAVLTRAASEGRVVLTHDLSTLIARAYDRVRSGDPMPGVIAVSQALPVAQVIEDLLLVVQCSTADDWTNHVRYLPLR